MVSIKRFVFLAKNYQKDEKYKSYSFLISVMDTDKIDSRLKKYAELLEKGISKAKKEFEAHSLEKIKALQTIKSFPFQLTAISFNLIGLTNSDIVLLNMIIRWVESSEHKYALVSLKKLTNMQIHPYFGKIIEKTINLGENNQKNIKIILKSNYAQLELLKIANKGDIAAKEFISEYEKLLMSQKEAYDEMIREINEISFMFKSYAKRAFFISRILKASITWLLVIVVGLGCIYSINWLNDLSEKSQIQHNQMTMEIQSNKRILEGTVTEVNYIYGASGSPTAEYWIWRSTPGMTDTAAWIMSSVPLRKPMLGIIITLKTQIEDKKIVFQFGKDESVVNIDLNTRVENEKIPKLTEILKQGATIRVPAISIGNELRGLDAELL